MNKPIDSKTYYTDDKVYNEFFKIVTSGCKFRYFSYDHKQAMEEYQQSNEYKDWEQALNTDGLNRKPKVDCWNMPKELKEKHKIERIGKLRQIDFSPSGRAWRFQIGNKYSKSYSFLDFYVNVFPIIEE